VRRGGWSRSGGGGGGRLRMCSCMSAWMRRYSNVRAVSLRTAIVGPVLGLVSVIKELKHHRTISNARAHSFGVQI
jgi:hypothetical protein